METCGASRQSKASVINDSMSSLRNTVNNLHTCVRELRGVAPALDAKCPPQVQTIPSVEGIMNSLGEELTVIRDEIQKAVAELREILL